MDKGKYDVVFNTKEDATTVLDRLKSILNQTHVVYQADMYDLLGFPTTHIDHKYGWLDLEGALITQEGTEWKIHMPLIKHLITEPLPEKAVEFMVHGHPDHPDGKKLDTYNEVLDFVTEIKSYDFVCQIFVIKKEVLYAWTR